MEFEFDTQDLNYSCAGQETGLIFPKAASDLKKGDNVIVKNRPCKILDIAHHKVGKHGAIKSHGHCQDIFTSKRCEFVAPGDYSMMCPELEKQEYLLIDIQEDSKQLCLLNEETNEEREDLDLPVQDNEELAAAIKVRFEQGKTLFVTVVKAMGISAIMAYKIDGR